MSWVLFIDESGSDRKYSPYEVLAGIAIEDKCLWELIRKISELQQEMFGRRLYTGYRDETKGTKLLNPRVFKQVETYRAVEKKLRPDFIKQIFEDGANPSSSSLTALAQAKIEYCQLVLDLCLKFKTKAFASIIPQSTYRPKPKKFLRKDYVFLFQRFYDFLKLEAEHTMGFIICDEIEKSASHKLLFQSREYFQKTKNGRQRSKLIIPELLFVHSDLTTMIQVADLIAYIISWGIRLKEMNEPAREELKELSDRVIKLKFTFKSYNQNVGQQHGFKLIKDLGKDVK